MGRAAGTDDPGDGWQSTAGTRLSAKGQVVIPKAIRDASGWQVGLELVAEATEAGVLLRPRALARERAVGELLGCVGYRGPRRSLEDMEAAVVREARLRR